MGFSAQDRSMMALALRQAYKGLYTADPNPRVGCVIVKQGEVTGVGWHLQAGGPHAEINALEMAGDVRGATCYVTLEPCSHYGKTAPCADALIRAGLSRVVVATGDPNPAVSGSGLSRLQKAGIQTETGCLKEEAVALNSGFMKRMLTGRPFVRLKMALSLDGAIALANGRSQWITGTAAREDVQRLRARSSAVLTGSGTLVADNPELTVRSEAVVAKCHGVPRQPLRLVLDSQGISDPSLQLFAATESLFPRSPVAILTSDRCVDRLKTKSFANHVLIKPVPLASSGSLELSAVMNLLGEWQCNELLVEAGPALAGALIDQHLVDELWLYQSNKLMGNKSRGAFNLPNYDQLEQVPALRLLDQRRVGDDTRMIFSLST